MRPLNTIQEDIERSMEKAILDCLVYNGYGVARVPNMTPNDYRVAKQAIINSKGFAVDLYGHGTPEDREKLDVPRIVITGMGFSPGSVGTVFGPSYELNQAGTGYNRFKWGAPLANYRVRVELWSNKTSQDRVLEQIRQAALPQLNFLRHYSNPELDYLLTYEFSASIPQLKQGLIHKIYTYEAKDVVESLAFQELGVTIAKIKEIRVEESKFKGNDSLELDTSDLIVQIPLTPTPPIPDNPGAIFVSEDGSEVFVSEDGQNTFTDESTPSPEQPGFLSEDNQNLFTDESGLNPFEQE